MLLKGKKGIIFGALDERSIAWKVAEKCKDNGAKFTLTNAPTFAPKLHLQLLQNLNLPSLQQKRLHWYLLVQPSPTPSPSRNPN